MNTDKHGSSNNFEKKKKATDSEKNLLNLFSYKSVFIRVYLRPIGLSGPMNYVEFTAATNPR